MNPRAQTIIHGIGTLVTPARVPAPIRGADVAAVVEVAGAAIAKGLDEKLDPGAETTGNGYETAPKLADAPADWRSAIEAAKASSFLKQALGEDLHRTFTEIKQAEYMRVARTVSELDYHLYLHEV